jgi:hypothetical protein
LKSLQKKLGVPLGSNLWNLIADYLIICWNLSVCTWNLYYQATKSNSTCDQT